jgi:hypothetical protein
MMRAVTGDSAWSHFPALSQKLGDDLQILVIDPQTFVCAEPTNLATEHRSTTRRSLFVVHSLPVCPSVHLSLCHNLTALPSNRVCHRDCQELSSLLRFPWIENPYTRESDFSVPSSVDGLCSSGWLFASGSVCACSSARTVK